MRLQADLLVALSVDKINIQINKLRDILYIIFKKSRQWQDIMITVCTMPVNLAVFLPIIRQVTDISRELGSRV